jgi:hypothetical protein
MAKSIPAQKARTSTENTNRKPLTEPEKGFFERTEIFLEKYQKRILYILLAVNLLFSLLLFDVKISVGGDDASYIERAFNFVEDYHNYPSYQGPLYPMMLAIPISIAGIKLVMLKMMSVLFALGHLVFMYLAFRRRIPWVILFTMLGYIAVSKFINYYSSMTYSESFFMMMQGLFLYLFFRLLDAIDLTGNTFQSFRQHWKQYLLVAFVMLLLSITKNVSLLVIVPVALYLLLKKQWRPMIIITALFILLKVPYEVSTRAAFGYDNTQMQILQQKHPYDASQGKEDLPGYFGRLVSNFKMYIPRHAVKLMGLRPDTEIPWQTKGNSFFAFLLLVFFITVLIFSYFRNRYVLFILLYIGITASAMFILLQTFWDSDRIIIILVPLIMIALLYGLYEFFRKSSTLKSILVLFCGLMFMLSFFPAVSKISKNVPVIRKNVKGDIYEGYSTDWVNYLKMSAWSAENLPENSLVAVRKGSMSFIYGKGKKFYGVYTFKTDEPDSVLSYFKNAGVTHVLLASLRSDPNRSNGNIINTLHRMVMPIIQHQDKKYRDKMVFVHRIGEAEAAEIWEFKY